MTTKNLYSMYLLADRLTKAANDAGVEVAFIQLARTYGKSDVHLQVSMSSDRTNEGNEAAAVALLDAIPESKLVREHGLVYVRGTNSLGLTYEFYTGSGVCERVQVGTRVVPAQPEREEPIYEVRCVDPILEAVSA